MSEKFEQLQYMWQEEKHQWVIVKLMDNDTFVDYIIFNTETSIEVNILNHELKSEFVQKLMAEGVTVVTKSVEEFYYSEDE